VAAVHRTWNGPEAAEIAKLFALVLPNYAAVVGSYQKAQDVMTQTVGGRSPMAAACAIPLTLNLGTSGGPRHDTSNQGDDLRAKPLIPRQAA
jgi:hypothetical protein